MDSALKGITVVECGHILNGPFAGRILAELGAQVIKVEPPNGEFYRHVPLHRMDGESGAFIYFNANKKSITLNLRHQEGREILLSLVEKADVFLENFAPGTMEKLGLGYETLKQVNPRIVYASSTGFGMTGPYKDRPAMDLVVQAMCGLVDINGSKDEPMAIGVVVTDYVAGIYTALGILAALFYRQETGTGQHVDIAMFDAGVSLCTHKMLHYLGGDMKRMGNQSAVIVPYDIYPTQDGQVAIILSGDEMWKKLVGVMGKLEWATDARLLTDGNRVRNREMVDKAIKEWLKGKTTNEAVRMLLESGVASGPVQLLEQLPDDPQVRAREMFVEVGHPKLGKVRIPGSVLKMSETPGVVKTPGYPLGYNNYEVYHDMLGYSSDEIARLAKEKII